MSRGRAWTGLVLAACLAAACDTREPPRTASPPTAAAQPPAPLPRDRETASSDAPPLDGVAYAVIELPSRGALRTVHGDWLESFVLPGSIAKIAIVAEALRLGIIDASTRVACTRRVDLSGGRRADCSHAVTAAPFDPADALAHSCNVFVTTVSRRMTRAQLSGGLTRAGLPPLTPAEDPAAASIGLGTGRVRAESLVGVILKGLDGPQAVRDGLAAAAERGTAAVLGRAGIEAYAKTGTSRMPNGRSLGLAVAVVPRARPERAAVALVPGGAGADAAAVLARVLARSAEADVTLGAPRPDGGYDVRTLRLEDYVAGIVAGESSGASPRAAREALAITARTFARANLERHRQDGFDLCALTHCQVWRLPDPGASAAAQATAGRVLTSGGRPAKVFYSAACGGTLDAASTLEPALGASPLPWTRARPDPAGVVEPEWEARLDARALVGALSGAGFRGGELRSLRLETDRYGRVRRVQVEGFEPGSMGGDEFRRLIGRDLGWTVIRSTRYTATRVGSGYELRGRGHGHGVGLCVFGASHLAAQGRSADEILGAYFDGLSAAAAEGPRSLRLRLPADIERHRPVLASLLERALDDLSAALGAPRTIIDVIVHPTGAAYRRATGRGVGTYAATARAAERVEIHTMPFATLQASGRLEPVLRHEIVHALVDGELTERPLWVREGLATHFAGERLPALDGPCPDDAELLRPASRAALAEAYRRAASCVAGELARGIPWRRVGGGAGRLRQKKVSGHKGSG